MNPDQGQTPEAWQQPPAAPSEYHPVNPASQPQPVQQPAPAAPASPPAAAVNQPQPATTPDVHDSVPQVEPESTLEDSQPINQFDDEDILQWQAIEGVERNRPMLWYVLLAIVVIALVAVAIFVVKSYTFAILIPVMALALIVYVRRPSHPVNYTLSRSGIHIGDRLVSYSTFRAFSVIQHDGVNTINLIPKKRFSLSEVLYFPEEIGEALVDAVAARLPMRDAKPDLLDRIVAKLRL